jgi:hypothetical protein
VILRNVVRRSFSSAGDYSDPLRVVAWLGEPRDFERFDEELERMITHSDIRKMHSIRWLCFYDEHYVDAIVCANMLLRRLLLDFCLSNETPQDEEFDDWTNSAKVYAAKVFQARFLPENIVQTAIRASEMTDDQLDQEDLYDCIAEYQALLQFLDAHSAYENWKEYISDTPSNIPFTPDSRFQDGTVESNTAMKMETMKYIKKKKEIAQGLVKVATVAKEALLKVLEFDKGWLNFSTDGNFNRKEMDESFDEDRERNSQIHILRSKCLPTVVSLLLRVCHTTALWMEDFTRDVEIVFEDESSDILSSITGFGFFESKGISNPFQSATWHRMSLLMANTVASSENKIAECMSKEELANFMTCMAETNICLLRIKDQKTNRK